LEKDRNHWKYLLALEALTRVLVEKVIFSMEQFLEMVRMANQEMKRKK